jgi:hypothetical protein
MGGWGDVYATPAPSIHAGSAAMAQLVSQQSARGQMQTGAQVAANTAFISSLGANTNAAPTGNMFGTDQYYLMGETFGNLRSSSNSSGGRTNIANRTVNVSIISNQSVTDIVSDIERLQSMDETSFFNSVS